jgi:hypothetical protein
MSWDTDVITSIRYIINDIDSVKYTDSRIKKSAVIAANQIRTELTLKNSYTITVSTDTISPDPSDVNYEDLGFINLITLKASLLILQGEVRLYESSGFKVMDGPSTIEVTGLYANTKGMIDALSLQYGKAKVEYATGVSGYGKAVIGPTIDMNIVSEYYYDRRS